MPESESPFRIRRKLKAKALETLEKSKDTALGEHPVAKMLIKKAISKIEESKKK